MLKIFTGINNSQRGSSAVQLLALMATASVVIGGVSVSAQGLVDNAKDVQGIANLRQMVTASELYYLDNSSYPQTGGDSSQERWEELIQELETGGYLASLPTPNDSYDYQVFNEGESYVLRFLLKDTENSFLKTDLDGQIGDLDCNDPYYCVGM